jgi:hypothetical protein
LEGLGAMKRGWHITPLDRALYVLRKIGQHQGREASSRDYDPHRLATLLGRDARVRRIIVEHVAQRCADAVQAGIER